MTEQPLQQSVRDTARQPVTYAVADGVATVTLNRPEAMNSLDIATKELLLDSVTGTCDVWCSPAPGARSVSART